MFARFFFCGNSSTNRVLAFMVAALVLASFDESNTAEAIIRADDQDAASYIVDPQKHREIFIMNNRHSDCRDGKAVCKFHPSLLAAEPANTQWIETSLSKSAKKAAKKAPKMHVSLSCTATLIGAKFAITSRSCFCHRGDDIGYNTSFNVWIGGKKHTVRKTWVPSFCDYSCKSLNKDTTGNRSSQCDIAIIELVEKVRKLKPYSIYDPKLHGSEVGKTIEFFGWGLSKVAGSVTPHTCKHGKIDGKFRHGRNVVIGLGKKGNLWQQFKNHLLEIKMTRKSKLKLQAIAAHGDTGIPAFITIKGRKYLAGVHSRARVDKHNLFKPCSYGSVDVFTRLAPFKTWIHDVVSKSFSKSANDKKLPQKKFRSAGYVDILPAKMPGRSLWPWHHQFGHRRRTSVSRGYKNSVPKVQNVCRRQAKRFTRPFVRNMKRHLCGLTKTFQTPIEFLAPDFPKKISGMITVQNTPKRWKLGHTPKKRSAEDTIPAMVKRMNKLILKSMFRSLNGMKIQTRKLRTKLIPRVRKNVANLRKALLKKVEIKKKTKKKKPAKKVDYKKHPGAWLESRARSHQAWSTRSRSHHHGHKQRQSRLRHRRSRRGRERRYRRNRRYRRSGRNRRARATSRVNRWEYHRWD